MSTTTLQPGLEKIPILLRGEVVSIEQWLDRVRLRETILFIAVIIVGSSAYGASMGLWRDPLQAVYTGIKFPLLILFTTVGNALLNGMLAPLFGLNLSFRQSLFAILMSYTIATAILGAFSPLIIFLVWNAPPIAEKREAFLTHSIILLTHVVAIAFAGIAANFRLLQLLNRLSGSSKMGRNILLVWLTGNLFLGSQLSWILRPFVGSPGLPIQFLRPDAFQGSFYETVFHALRHLFVR